MSKMGLKHQRVSQFLGVAITSYHKLGDLGQQKFILFQLCRPEIQGPDVSRVVLPLKALGDNLFLAFFRCGWLLAFLESSSLQSLPPSSRGLCLSSVYVSSSSDFYKEYCHWIQGLSGQSRMISTQNPLLYLQGSFVQIRPHSCIVGVRMQTYVFKGYHSAHYSQAKGSKTQPQMTELSMFSVDRTLQGNAM